jgi:hypothetical protein
MDSQTTARGRKQSVAAALELAAEAAMELATNLM